MKDRGDSSSPQLLTVPSGRISTRPNGSRPFEEIGAVLCFRQRTHKSLATVVVLRLGLVRAPSEWERGQCVDYGCALLAFGAADEQAWDTDTGWWGGYWGVLFEGAGVVGEGSSVECWVDDNYAGAKVFENAADIGDAIPTYVFSPLFFSPSDE